MPTALRLPVDHRLAPTARAGTSLWTTLDKDYGLLLLRSRRGCAPRTGISGNVRPPLPPAARVREKNVFLFLEGLRGSWKEEPAEDLSLPFFFLLVEPGSCGCPLRATSGQIVQKFLPDIQGLPLPLRCSRSSPQPFPQPWGCRQPTALHTALRLPVAHRLAHPAKGVDKPVDNACTRTMDCLGKAYGRLLPGCVFRGLGHGIS